MDESRKQAAVNVLSELKEMELPVMYAAGIGGACFDGYCNEDETFCISGDAIRYLLSSKLSKSLFKNLPKKKFDLEKELAEKAFYSAFPDGFIPQVYHELPVELANYNNEQPLVKGKYTFHYDLLDYYSQEPIAENRTAILNLSKTEIEKVVYAVLEESTDKKIWDKLRNKIYDNVNLIDETPYTIEITSPHLDNYIDQRAEMIKAILYGSLPIEQIGFCEEDFFEAQEEYDWEDASFEEWLEEQDFEK